MGIFGVVSFVVEKPDACLVRVRVRFEDFGYRGVTMKSAYSLITACFSFCHLPIHPPALTQTHSTQTTSEILQHG